MKVMKKIKKQGDEDRGKEENNKFLKQIQENIYKTVKGYGYSHSRTEHGSIISK